MADGILLIDKPTGWTSFDVVNKIRHMIQSAGLNSTGRKRFPVGHTGTLDPLATGLLVLLLGTYTKKAPELTKLDKIYQVEMRLGQTSTTGDNEGERTHVSDRQPLVREIESTLQQFVGDTLQRPPIFSAVKIDGQRAYNLARAGKTMELNQRPIHLEWIKLDKYTYPTVEFTVHVSSGTYIRSLAEDVGKALGTGAYVSSLRRTSVGPFKISDAISMEDINPQKILEKVRQKSS